MKKVLIILAFGTISLKAQQNFSLANNGGFLPQDNAVFNRVNSNGANKTLTYADVQGTPYMTQNFIIANISNVKDQTLVRYNAYADEFEFQKDGKTFVIPKQDEYSSVQLTTERINFVLRNGDSDFSGYFVEVVKGKNSLLKKLKTRFIDVKPATSSYATDTPATFKQSDPKYFIEVGKNAVIKDPKNLDDIISQLPDKKDALKSFFKSNKIKFNKEQDLIKLVNFLNES